LTTVASIAALAAGVTEMMYLAFAPRSKADVGTMVELSEKIVSITINDARNLAFERVSMRTPWVVHTMSGHCDNFTLNTVKMGITSKVNNGQAIGANTD
jgi:hypothetical protein